MQNRSRTETAVILLVACVWAASFIADIVLPDYEPSAYIHFAMMAILGALFGRSIWRGGK